jgi:hypothetical protein
LLRVVFVRSMYDNDRRPRDLDMLETQPLLGGPARDNKTVAIVAAVVAVIVGVIIGTSPSYPMRTVRR